MITRKEIMIQETLLAQSIGRADCKVRYDAHCKQLLADKQVLARIMKHTMPEYEDYSVEEISTRYIEGVPEISTVPLLPDETNAPRIFGVGIEDKSINEGTITYDIRFFAVLPDVMERIGLIINIEAQNEFHPGYPIVKRGIYYCSRMISAQYGTIFAGSHYEMIRKVYSIWICMSPPQSRKNTITEYSLKEEQVVGDVHEAQEHYDLISIIMICLGEENDAESNPLLSMLDTLLSPQMDVLEKKKRLKAMGLQMNKEIEKEVSSMCNLSDGVEQIGFEKGMKQTKELLITNLFKHNFSIEEICSYMECDKEFVLKVTEKIA